MEHPKIAPPLVSLGEKKAQPGSAKYIILYCLADSLAFPEAMEDANGTPRAYPGSELLSLNDFVIQTFPGL